jgi:hypothetical protein
VRLFFAIVLACCVAGCNVESNVSSETTVTNPDGSITKVKTETRTKNGVKTETKTETTMKAGTMTTVVYDKKGNDWVKRDQ